MVSKKDRRHSGHVTPRPTVPIKSLKNPYSGLVIEKFYDSWVDYRDGFRRAWKDRNGVWHYMDKTLHWNEKARRHERIRKIRKKVKE